MTPWYSRRRRRVILDMHIGDWDPGFLAKLDPRRIADACVRSRLDALMLYAISHVGLCYWPTPHGKVHAGLKGRDFVGELLTELRRRDLAAVGYISVIFDTWAFLTHPDWRLQPGQVGPELTSDQLFSGSRYGLVCPNNPAYRSYILAQTDDLYGRYAFDGAFFDMTFWPNVCECRHCRDRCQNEEGIAIPQTVDWLDPDWCRFQAARERWLAEFALELSAHAQTAQPGISTHHNFACFQHNWRAGVSEAATAASSFLGADFYGDALEQLFVCKLYDGLSRDRPLEFMTTRCPTPGYHEQVKSAAQMRMQVLGATFASAAFMWIDAMNLDGTINEGVYDRIGGVFGAVEPYQAYLGGTPVADVAVYFSGASKMDFRENGTPLVSVTGSGPSYPHIVAARGWARMLQQQQILFNVVTAKDLPTLDRYRVVILPNVLRLSAAEAAAMRDYVRGGGALYASRYTSLTSPDGRRGDDFALADVFGCHFAADDLGTVNYLRPVAAGVAAALAPQACLDHFARPGSAAEAAGCLRLSETVTGEVLATLTLPFDKDWGDMFDQRWGSIHSSPPWRDTGLPALVCNRFGRGRCVYAAADIETVVADANANVLRHLLDWLRDVAPPIFSSDAPASVWTAVHDQPELQRQRLGMLNYQAQLPPIPISGIAFTMRPPPGCRFTSLVSVPGEAAVPFELAADGTLHARIARLDEFAMLLAGYEKP